ncbi:MAG: RsmE family RNA methyltransferase [Nannocystaceae bacterium]|nr:RsmE family RNA methyltransferase [bacterium]
MIRVFAEATQPGLLTLPPDESHYLVRVRRARQGAALEVLGERSGGWRAEVVLADNKHAQVRLVEPLAPRPAWAIDLAVGVTDAKAAYDVIARAAECGARSLTFLETARSQPTRLNPARVNRVLAAARRQCGRLDVLPVQGPIPLHTWLGTPRRGFVASVAQRGPATTVVGEAEVLLGPEGGLTEAEEHEATGAGLCPLSLGPFVLRTEVAVAASIAVAARIAEL